MGELMRREVAVHRVEWLINPPDPAKHDPDNGSDEYTRYEDDRIEVMRRIMAEASGVPADLRVQDGDTVTVISYEASREYTAGSS